MGDIRIGDVVHGKNGTTTVLNIYPQGIRPVYKISFSDGSTTEATADHLWSISRCDKESYVCTTEEIKNLGHWSFTRSYIPQQKAVQYDSAPPPVDAWLLGFLIGDGCFRTESLTFSCDRNDKETLNRIKEKTDGFEIKYLANSDWGIRKNKSKYKHALIQQLKRDGLWGAMSDEKFAPDYIKFGSIKTRIEFIQGLFDADGYVNKHGQPALEQTSKRLARDVTHIIRSLGGVVKNRERENSYKANGKTIPAKRVYSQVIAISEPKKLFALSRKKDKCLTLKKPVKRTFRSIEYIGEKECQCIEVDASDSLYLTDDYITTHNTHGCMAWILEQSLQPHAQAGQNFWWVAPVYQQAQIAYKRLKHSLPHDIFTFTDSKLMIFNRENQTIMLFKSGEKPDNLYGDDVYAAVVDEASRIREESWHALRSTLTFTKAPVRMIGNVKGRLNWFYKLCRRAEAGEPEMEYHKLTCWDAVEAGVLDAAEIEDAKRTLPEQVFRELYLAEPSDDGGNPFGLKAIEDCIAPLSMEPVEAWGIDLAKSFDYTVLIGLDAKGRTAYFERFQKPWQDTIRHLRSLVGYGRALVDSTGVGDAVLESLQADGQINFEGFKFTQASKQQLMEGLAVAIQDKAISYPAGTIPTELSTFEFELTRTGVKYTAPEGMHDDCVCALALAQRHLKLASVGDNIISYYKNLRQKGINT